MYLSILTIWCSSLLEDARAILSVKNWHIGYVCIERYDQNVEMRFDIINIHKDDEE